MNVTTATKQPAIEFPRSDRVSKKPKGISGEYLKTAIATNGIFSESWYDEKKSLTAKKTGVLSKELESLLSQVQSLATNLTQNVEAAKGVKDQQSATKEVEAVEAKIQQPTKKEIANSFRDTEAQIHQLGQKLISAHKPVSDFLADMTLHAGVLSPKQEVIVAKVAQTWNQITLINRELYLRLEFAKIACLHLPVIKEFQLALEKKKQEVVAERESHEKECLDTEVVADWDGFAKSTEKQLESLKAFDEKAMAMRDKLIKALSRLKEPSKLPESAIQLFANHTPSLKTENEQKLTGAFKQINEDKAALVLSLETEWKSASKALGQLCEAVLHNQSMKAPDPENASYFGALTANLWSSRPLVSDTIKTPVDGSLVKV